MRKMAWLAVGLALALAVALLSLQFLRGDEGAYAQGAVNFDIDPEITGNSAGTLGTVEDCYEISVPAADLGDGVADHTVDVVVTGDTQAPIAYDAWVNYDQTLVHIVDPTDVVIKLTCTGETFSEPRPDSDGLFLATEVCMTGVGIAGNGTLVRLGIDAQAAGVLTFSLEDPPGTAYASDAGPHKVSRDTGMLAINQDCPPAPPPPPPPPPNDDFDNATVIPGLPFLDLIDTRGATTAADDPDCFGQGPTVWYSLTATDDMRIEANTFGTNYDTTLSVYTGMRGALTQIVCNDDAQGPQSQVRFDAVAGETYFFMVGAFASGPGGDLVFSVDIGPPPLDIELSIDAVGSVVPKTGVATISGRVSCTRPASVDVFGELRQRAGRLIIHSYFFDLLACDGDSPWSATVIGENGLYKAGRADVSLSAFAFAEGEFDWAEASATVQLKGSRPPRLCPRGGNDGFEAGVVDTNVIPCWTVVDQAGGYGSWCNQTGTTPPQGPCWGSFTPVAAPPEELQAAMTNQSGPGSHVLYRCGALGSGPLSFELYINNEAGVFFNPGSLDYGVFPNQQFRADLVTAAGIAADPFTVKPADILLNIYQTLPGDPPVSGYTTVTADVSSYVGQSVCLRFAQVENLYHFHAGIDDVSIDVVQRGRSRNTH